MIKKLRSPLNIALCVLTVLLFAVLLVSFCLWVIYAGGPLNDTALTARDICNASLPLIGICIMFIIISVRSLSSEEKASKKH